MKKKSLWVAIKRDIHERFANFETFNGLFVFLPWGLGFIYCGLYDLRLGYSYAMISAGVVLLVMALRKIFVNRIHQCIKQEKLVLNCKHARGENIK